MGLPERRYGKGFPCAYRETEMGRDGVKYLVNGTGQESTISSRGGIMERVANTGKCSPAWLISRSGTRGGDNGRNEETDTYLLLFVN